MCVYQAANSIWSHQQLVVQRDEFVISNVRSDGEPAHIDHTLLLDGGCCGHYSLVVQGV